jgi:hypothetical protein
VLGAAACIIVLARGLAAQASATVDLGVSRVDYDGFLPSEAVALTPALTLERERGSFDLRGTYAVFASGNRSMQGAITGSGFRRVPGAWRAELWATVGGSRYTDLARFWHGLGGVRTYRPVGSSIFWIDATVGATSYGQGSRPVAVAGAGIWTNRRGVELGFSASHARVGDTTYTDFRAEGRSAPLWGARVQGEVGTRVWSRGGGSGVYAEATASLPLGTRWAFVLAGGRYPTNPARGSISGRYLSAAQRLTAARPRVAHAPPEMPVRESHSSPAGRGTSAPDHGRGQPWLGVRSEPSGAIRLRVLAGPAGRVEIAGDFTDWTPLALTPVGGGVWETTAVIAPGVHRVNVRVGNGPWIAPGGTTRADDDYNGEVGLFVVR